MRALFVYELLVSDVTEPLRLKPSAQLKIFELPTRARGATPRP